MSSMDWDWTEVALPDTWFPYHWEGGEVYDLADGHKTQLRKRPFEPDRHLAHRALPTVLVVLV